MNKKGVKKEKAKSMSVMVFALFIVIVCMVIGLGLYVRENIELNNNKSDGSKDDSSIKINDSIKIDDNKDYVYDAEYKYDNQYSEYDYGDGDKLTEDGFETVIYQNSSCKLKNIKVPYININSSEVNTINNTLKNLYEEYVKRFDDFAMDGDMVGSEILTYYKYQYNNILSIVVTYGFQTTDVLYPKYYTYNFDLESGKLLGYDSLLDKLNMDKEGINDKVKDALDKYVSENVSSNIDAFRVKKDGTSYSGKSSDLCYDDYIDNLSSNSLLYFMDNNGKLNIINNIYNGVGSGYMPHIVIVE